MRLTPAEWREELRERHARALDIAHENERLHGFWDGRTVEAYKFADKLNAVMFHEGA